MPSEPKISAPYRFVPLNAEVVETPLTDEQLSQAHDHPLNGGLSATLTVEWAAETPLLIGEARTEGGGTAPDEIGPLRMGGDYAIPGASIRGMLRSVMEIACFARLRQINGHHRYALRDFNHSHYKASLLEASAIGAGWLRKDGERWFIRRCAWKPVEIDSLLEGLGIDAEAWLKSDRFGKFSLLGMANGNKNAFTVDFSQELRLSGSKRLRRDPEGSQMRIVVSGKAVATTGRYVKKVEYAFEPDNTTDDVEVHPDAWRDFVTVNTKPAKNRAEPVGAWAEWQAQIAAGLEVPVFFSGDPAFADCAIGLTRLFRLPSKFSVAAIRDKAVRHRMKTGDRRDFVEALFGYVDEPGDLGAGSQGTALRSRIRFGFARLTAGNARETAPADVVMMGPRASFAPFYLTNPTDPADWSDGGSWLAGRKRYPVRFDADREKALDDIRARFSRSTQDKKGQPISDATRTRLSLLVPDDDGELVFKGEIRLHNVTPEELGAVIWALRFGEIKKKTLRHALGRGKAFGCGQMRVKSIGLRTYPHDPGRSEWSTLIAVARDIDRPPEGEHWIPAKPASGPDWVSLAPFQNAFFAYMKTNVPDWATSDTIKALRAAAYPTLGEALRRADLLNYLGEKGADQKAEDGHTAHMRLKTAHMQRKEDSRRRELPLPWIVKSTGTDPV